MSSGLAGLTAFTLLYVLMEGWGWTASTGGFWTVLIVSIIVGIVVVVLIRKHIWLMVGCFTAIGGFVGGVFLTTLIAGTTGYAEAWLWWTLGIVCAIAGFFIGKKLGGPAINAVTSFIGSYLVTKALTMFFWTDHWPSDSDIMNGTINTEELGW